MDWPRYLLWPLLALSLFLAGKGILREQSVRREQSLRREGHRLSRFRGPLALAGICIVCFSLINVVGFLPFAFIMAGAASVLLGRRHFSTHLIRSGEHTSELQSLMRQSYAVFCLKKKKKE